MSWHPTQLETDDRPYSMWSDTAWFYLDTKVFSIHEATKCRPNTKYPEMRDHAWECGNYFRTKEQANNALEKLKSLFGTSNYENPIGKKNCDYFYVDLQFIRTHHLYDTADGSRYEQIIDHGNYFKTKEEAEKKLKEVTQLLQSIEKY